MKRLLHAIAHLFRFYTGTVETWWREDGMLMIGFKCDVCGKISGVHESPFGTRR